MKIQRDHQPYRKKPFVARWYEGTRQRNRFFSSVAARDEFIAEFKKHAQRADPSLPTIEPHKLIRWQQAMMIAPDADPVEVFKFWAAEQKKLRKLGERYLRDASAAYIQSMERIGRNQSYIGHVRRALTDLEAEFGNRLVRDFTGQVTQTGPRNSLV